MSAQVHTFQADPKRGFLVWQQLLFNTKLKMSANIVRPFFPKVG